MPTPSEQKALAFVAIVVLLGGAVRVLRAGSSPGPTPLEQQALARQATAAESAASAAPAGRGRKGRSVRLARPKRGAGPTEVGGVIGYPLGAPSGGQAPMLGRNGFPPPGPRIDIDNRPNLQSRLSTVRGSSDHSESPSTRSQPVDLDRASEQEIDVLPRVGPAIAHRIVANRDSFGPFGSLEALRRVKGMGPATLERLSPLVTFSGRPSSRP